MDVPEETNPAANPDPAAAANQHYPEFALESPPRPISYWVRKFLVCNPFYVVSAASLLYGVYLVSIDTNFPGKEIAQLAFNFTSLQCYEILLVGTAILLARRRIWYDSNLLIFLENGIILVPFVLLSQAALIGQGAVRVMCGVSGILALVRFATLKRMHVHLNLPPRLLGAGAVLLFANVALLLTYRTLNETKVGTKPTDGAAYHLNECGWLLILPAIVALANVLPRPKQAGELLAQRRWIPIGLFALWIAGSTVHLCCLGYVYNFDWENPFMVPPIWVLVWTVCNRLPDFFHCRGVRPALLIAPAVVTVLAAANSAPRLFVVLAGVNILIYSILLVRNHSSRTLRHLTVLSLASLGFGLVGLRHIPMPFDVSITECVWAAAVVYVCYWICLSRDPKLGIVGGVLVWIATANLSFEYSRGLNAAVQCGFFFLLLHSLLWRDESHPGARSARVLACCLWSFHSILFICADSPHSTFILSTGSTLLLVACMVIRFVRCQWPPLVLPTVAAGVLFVSQGNRLSGPAESIPVGLWVVAGSFVLFAVGTALALAKSRSQSPPGHS